MRDRTSLPADERPPVPDFTPVPRVRPRHDGWTPERQRAFIAALAECGSVTAAARRVNMAHATAYALRHHPAAAEFRAAWDAALSCGVQRLRDEAFDRAVNGQLHPVFHAGKLIGYRRVKNDRLLMYMLRHYGQDAQGKRITLNYFASPSTPLPLPRERDRRGTRQGEGMTATPRVDHHPALPAPEAAAQTLAAFEGVPLDDEAQAQIVAVLESCAARLKEQHPEDDPEIPYVRTAETSRHQIGTFELTGTPVEEYTPFAADEHPWETLCESDNAPEIEAAVASVLRAKASGFFDKPVQVPPGNNLPSRPVKVTWFDNCRDASPPPFRIDPDDEAQPGRAPTAPRAETGPAAPTPSVHRAASPRPGQDRPVRRRAAKADPQTG